MKTKIFFLALSVLFGSWLLTSCKKDFGDQREQVLNQNSTAERGGSPVVRNPLFIPAVVSPSGLTLNESPGVADLGGNSFSNVWYYNGSFPAPTIKANSGDVASVLLQNNLPEQTITHWHGLVVSPANDGQPSQAIAPGSTYSYNFSINQRAALNFYHPHPHMLTGKQVYLGLAGAFIVNDVEEAALNLPAGAYEVPLILRDATVDASGNLKYQPSAGGMFGKFPLVNGTKNAYLNVERAVYRFRILNGANSRVFKLALNNNSPMILIGNDGGLLPSSTNQTNITMGNGERIDVLIDFRLLATGTKVMLRDANAGWDLVEFRVTGTTVVPYTGAMTTTSVVTPLTQNGTTRTFTFDAMSKINGLVYDMNRVDFYVPFGQTEKWMFTANGNAPHPIHVHGASFQVVSRTGGRAQVFPWEAGWKDTVLLENGETVTILIRFNAYTGNYLIHCHKLEHEDMGMMSNFVVQ
jgi:blue copper oxidase